MGLHYSQEHDLFRLDEATAPMEAIAKKQGFDYSNPSRKWYTQCPYMAVGSGLPFSNPGKAEPLIEAYQKSWVLDGSPNLLVPDGMEAHAFQSAGVNEILSRGKNCLLGDPPGVGKTMQAICVANEMLAQRVVIICPAAVRRNWVREIRRWSMIKNPSIWLTEALEDWVNPRANFQILSFNGVSTPELYNALARGGR